MTYLKRFGIYRVLLLPILSWLLLVSLLTGKCVRARPQDITTSAPSPSTATIIAVANASSGGGSNIGNSVAAAASNDNVTEGTAAKDSTLNPINRLNGTVAHGVQIDGRAGLRRPTMSSSGDLITTKKDVGSIRLYGEFNVDSSGLDVNNATTTTTAIVDVDTIGKSSKIHPTNNNALVDMVVSDVRTPPKIKSQIAAAAAAHSSSSSSPQISGGQPGKGEAIPIILDENDDGILEKLSADNFKYDSSSSGGGSSMSSSGNGISTWVLLNSDPVSSVPYSHNNNHRKTKPSSSPTSTTSFDYAINNNNNINSSVITATVEEQKRIKPNKTAGNISSHIWGGPPSAAAKKPPPLKHKPDNNATTNPPVERKPPIAASIQKVSPPSVVKKTTTPVSLMTISSSSSSSEDPPLTTFSMLQDSKFKTKTPVIVGKVPLKDKVEPPPTPIINTSTTPMVAIISTNSNNDNNAISSDDGDKIVRLGTPVVTFPHVPPRQRPSTTGSPQTTTLSTTTTASASAGSIIGNSTTAIRKTANTTKSPQNDISGIVETSQVTTSSSIITDKTSTISNKKKKKKNKNKKKKRPATIPAAADTIESKISPPEEGFDDKISTGLVVTSADDNNIPSVGVGNNRPLSTRIYNYLAREVMPNVGVGLVGLVLTAGLAGILLYPFGVAAPIRRNYYEKPSDISSGYNNNNNNYLNEIEGQPEESIFSQILAGMNQQQYGRDNDPAAAVYHQHPNHHQHPVAAAAAPYGYNNKPLSNNSKKSTVVQQPPLKYDNHGTAIVDKSPSSGSFKYDAPSPPVVMGYKPAAPKFEPPSATSEYKTIYENGNSNNNPNNPNNPNNYKFQSSQPVVMTTVKFDAPTSSVLEYNSKLDGKTIYGDTMTGHHSPVYNNNNDNDNNKNNNKINYSDNGYKMRYETDDNNGYKNHVEYKLSDDQVEYKPNNSPLIADNNRVIKYPTDRSSEVDQNDFIPKQQIISQYNTNNNNNNVNEFKVNYDIVATDNSNPTEYKMKKYSTTNSLVEPWKINNDAAVVTFNEKPKYESRGGGSTDGAGYHPPILTTNVSRDNNNNSSSLLSDDLGDVVSGPHESVKFSSFGLDDVVKYSTIDKSHPVDTLVDLTTSSVDDHQRASAYNNDDDDHQHHPSSSSLSSSSSDDDEDDSSDNSGKQRYQFIAAANEVSPPSSSVAANVDATFNQNNNNNNPSPFLYGFDSSYTAYNNPNEPIQRPIYKGNSDTTHNIERKNHKDKSSAAVVNDYYDNFERIVATTERDYINNNNGGHVDKIVSGGQPVFSALEGIPKNYRTLDTSITIEDAVLPLNQDSPMPVYKQAEHGPRSLKITSSSSSSRKKRNSWSENEIDSVLTPESTNSDRIKIDNANSTDNNGNTTAINANIDNNIISVNTTNTGINADIDNNIISVNTTNTGINANSNNNVNINNGTISVNTINSDNNGIINDIINNSSSISFGNNSSSSDRPVVYVLKLQNNSNDNNDTSLNQQQSSDSPVIYLFNLQNNNNNVTNSDLNITTNIINAAITDLVSTSSTTPSPVSTDSSNNIGSTSSPIETTSSLESVTTESNRISSTFETTIVSTSISQNNTTQPPSIDTTVDIFKIINNTVDMLSSSSTSSETEQSTKSESFQAESNNDNNGNNNVTEQVTAEAAATTTIDNDSATSNSPTSSNIPNISLTSSDTIDNGSSAATSTSNSPTSSSNSPIPNSSLTASDTIDNDSSAATSTSNSPTSNSNSPTSSDSPVISSSSSTATNAAASETERSATTTRSDNNDVSSTTTGTAMIEDCFNCFNIDNIPSATEEPPKKQQTESFSLTNFFRNVIEFKIRLGMELLKVTSDALSRYANGIQKRMAETVRYLQKTNSRVTQATVSSSSPSTTDGTTRTGENSYRNNRNFFALFRS